MASRNPAVSVVIPCYNEANGMQELYRRVKEVCERVCGEDYELILVNDGSKDETWYRIAGLAEKDKRVIGVNLARNYGQQMATTAGLQISKGDRAFILDCDLQDPPELLKDMMDIMDRDKADVVYGQRLNRPGESAFKIFTSKLFYRLINHLSKTKMPVDTGDFRLMNRRVINIYLKMPERTRFFRGMINWIGFKQVPLQFQRSPRFSGRTTYNWKSLLALATDAICGYSMKPLRLTTITGFIVIAISLLILLSGKVFWAFMVFLHGLQFIFIGIMGEYLGRIHVESERRPLYLIDTVINAENPQGLMG